MIQVYISWKQKISRYYIVCYGGIAAHLIKICFVINNPRHLGCLKTIKVFWIMNNSGIIISA